MQAARRRGVDYFMAVASDLAEAERLARELADEPGAYSSVGVHPHVAGAFDGDYRPYRELLSACPKVRAVGEIGLDYHYEYSSRQAQLPVFEGFLKLAVEQGYPAIVHCRDAYEDCLEIIDRAIPAGHPYVIHSYTGGLRYLSEFQQRQAWFSVNGIVTFKKAEDIRAAVRAIPLERLLLETDAPYLAPVPYRGRRNTPAYLVEIAQCVAELKGISLAEIARVTTANARLFFRLP